MDILPVELMVRIFWYIDFVDIKRMAETNKRHFTIIKENKKYLPGLNDQQVPYWYLCKSRNFMKE